MFIEYIKLQKNSSTVLTANYGTWNYIGVKNENTKHSFSCKSKLKRQ